jgi:hypothetical protein
MITTADTGQLIVYVTDDPIDDTAVASVMDMVTGGDKPVLIDASQGRNCFELEQFIARAVEIVFEKTHRSIVISNLLGLFYDSSISTREAAQSLGRVKSLLESLVEHGVQIAVLCQRLSTDLGTRSHFMVSVCASADRVHFLRRM